MVKKFCIRLFSDANSNLFPSNNLSSFTNLLGTQIKLDPALDWNVALSSITLNHCFDTYDSEIHKTGDALIIHLDTFTQTTPPKPLQTAPLASSTHNVINKGKSDSDDDENDNNDNSGELQSDQPPPGGGNDDDVTTKLFTVEEFVKIIFPLTFSPMLYNINYFDQLQDMKFHYDYDSFKRIFNDYESLPHFRNKPIHQDDAVRHNRQSHIINIRFDTTDLLHENETLDLVIPRFPGYVEQHTNELKVKRYGRIECELYSDYGYTLMSLLLTLIHFISYSLRIYFNGSENDIMRQFKSKFMAKENFSSFYSHYKTHAEAVDLLTQRFIDKFIQCVLDERQKYMTLHNLHELDESFFLFVYTDIVRETTTGKYLLIRI